MDVSIIYGFIAVCIRLNVVLQLYFLYGFISFMVLLRMWLRSGYGAMLYTAGIVVGYPNLLYAAGLNYQLSQISKAGFAVGYTPHHA